MIVQLTLLGLISFAALASAGKQRITVTGKVFCQSDPKKTTGVKVKLMDYDLGPDPDDLLDEKTTGSDGTFSLSGETSELTRIDPQIRIYHDCNDGWRPCQREWKLNVPKAYINNKTFEMGEINLDLSLNHEHHDCIH